MQNEDVTHVVSRRPGGLSIVTSSLFTDAQ